MLDLEAGDVHAGAAKNGQLAIVAYPMVVYGSGVRTPTKIGCGVFCGSDPTNVLLK